jgi:two-component system, NarL family, nitrate/nitrite response regulator NarL
MHDVFITTLSKPLEDWKKAFPKLILSNNVAELQLPHSDDLVFWLHMNEDRQQWLQETIQYILAQYKTAKVVVLANLPNQAEALFVLGQGALGYNHSYGPAAILKEIRTVMAHGGIWLGNELLKKLIEVSTKVTNTQADYVDSMLDKLTAREKETAEQAAKGLSNKEIARILDVTPRTVKAHLAAVFEKLQVKDRLHLALVLNKKLNI